MWQTRRLSGLKEINQEPNRWINVHPVPGGRLLHIPYKGLWVFNNKDGNSQLLKPRYRVGDVVYIKEAWADNVLGCPRGISYKLDHQDPLGDGPAHPMKWRSPMFMPEWAARYFIKITGVRCERLQDITINDCLNEGIKDHVTKIGDAWLSDAKNQYSELWDSINPNHPWSNNDWVWVYSFKKVERPE